FHHVVLAVKEVCRVARIEGHRRKSWKRRKLRPRPFPAVSNKVVHAESAGARWMRPHWRRIPRLKIKVARARTRRFFSPRIAALPTAVRRSVRCARKLRFGRKTAAEPF